MLNAEQIVAVLLDEAVIYVYKTVEHLLELARYWAAKSIDLNSFVWRINNHPDFTKNKVILMNAPNPRYNTADKWIEIPIGKTIAETLQVMVDTLQHEFVHKRQHGRSGYMAEPGGSGRSVSFAERPTDKKLSWEWTKKRLVGQYLASPWETMAYAHTYVTELQRLGLTKEQIFKEIQSGKLVNSDYNKLSEPLKRASIYYSKAFPKMQNRFLKYAYEYAQRLKT